MLVNQTTTRVIVLLEPLLARSCYRDDSVHAKYELVEEITMETI